MSSEPVQEDIGIVVEMTGRIARVELERGGGCKGCSMRGMCFSKGKPAVFELATDLDLAPGDRVSIVISPRARILSSLLIFLMPVLFLFLGFVLASRFMAELPSIGVAFCFMAVSFLIVRLIDRKMGNHLEIRLGEKL
ncbi:MAG TPA: SoxR reducing system RseC family protein [Candidatus Cloacimonadota bacterium]|nr:SoxR reducing system RseC family protein [Candidatus Cloacimonadota bacterium]